MRVPLIRGGWKAHAAGVVSGITVLVVGIGLLALIWLFARPLGIAFLGIVVAQALMPVVARLEKWMPRILAIAVVYLSILVVVVGLGWIIAPRLVDQVNRVVEQIPELTSRVQDVFSRWDDQSGGRVGEFVSNAIGAGADLLISLPATLVNSVLDLFFLVFTSIYWLIAAPNARKWFLSLFPERTREQAADILSELGYATGGYVRGEVLSSLMIGTMATAGLWVIGFEYPIVGGIISAIGEIFPIIGPVLAAVPVTVLALLDSPTQAAIVLAFYIVLQQIESQLVAPNIMSSQTTVPQVLVLFATFAGGGIGGVVGVLIAIPLMAAVKVLVVRLIAPAIRIITWDDPAAAAEANQTSAE